MSILVRYFVDKILSKYFTKYFGKILDVYLSLVWEKQCRSKVQPQVPGMANLVVSAPQVKATCPRPKFKPMPPKYYVLFPKEGPVVGDVGTPGRGGMLVPGGCRCHENSHKDGDIRAPRRTERII